MMKLKDVKKFFIHLAVSKFNDMYNTSYKDEDFDIVSMQHERYKYSFEVFTLRDDDSFRLRIYLEEGQVTFLDRYHIFEQNNGWVGEGDNVFVAYGTLGDDFFTYNDNLTRRSITFLPSDFNRLAILLAEDGTELLLEDGSFMHLEIATPGGLYPTNGG